MTRYTNSWIRRVMPTRRRPTGRRLLPGSLPSPEFPHGAKPRRWPMRRCSTGWAPFPRACWPRPSRCNPRDAERVVERSRTAQAAPVFGDALSTGRIAAGHLDYLAISWRRLEPGPRAVLLADAPRLVVLAAASTPDNTRARRTRRRTTRRQLRPRKRSGMAGAMRNVAPGPLVHVVRAPPRSADAGQVPSRRGCNAARFHRT